MFENIGRKIKRLAEIVCWVGIILFCILGLILCIALGNEYVMGAIGVFIGLIVAIVGSLLSWIGSFFTYGFGEIIDNLQQITGKKDTKAIKPEYRKTEVQEKIMGTCDLCETKDMQLTKVKIVDDMGTRYKYVCKECFERNGFKPKTVDSLSTNNTSLSVKSIPAEENTWMCMGCGRILPNTTTKCPCGSSYFKIQTDYKICKYCGERVPASKERCDCGCIVFE